MNKDEMPPQKLPVDADTLNAITDAMGALALCLARQLTPEQRAGMARNLAQLAAREHASGNVMQGRLMSDLSRAAATA